MPVKGEGHRGRTSRTSSMVVLQLKTSTLSRVSWNFDSRVCHAMPKQCQKNHQKQKTTDGASGKGCGMGCVSRGMIARFIPSTAQGSTARSRINLQVCVCVPFFLHRAELVLERLRQGSGTICVGLDLHTRAEKTGITSGASHHETGMSTEHILCNSLPCHAMPCHAKNNLEKNNNNRQCVGQGLRDGVSRPRHGCLLHAIYNITKACKAYSKHHSTKMRSVFYKMRKFVLEHIYIRTPRFRFIFQIFELQEGNRDFLVLGLGRHTRPENA